MTYLPGFPQQTVLPTGTSQSIPEPVGAGLVQPPHHLSSQLLTGVGEVHVLRTVDSTVLSTGPHEVALASFKLTEICPSLPLKSWG